MQTSNSTQIVEDDSDRRLEMAVWFQGQLEEDPDFVSRNMLFSDEANFYVSGEVNRQNCQSIRKNILILC